MSVPEGPLKRTPLNQIHRALGAKMVPFGGWDMPVQYSGILEEHRVVRTDRKSTRLNSSHIQKSRMPSSA